MSPVPADLPPLPPQFAHAAPSAVVTGADPWQPYRVKPGDTLYDLAATYNTTVKALVQRNGLSHGGRWIRAGEVIEVPRKAPAGKAAAAGKGKASTKSSSGAGKAAAASSGGTTVTVRPGDTLSHIALRHNTTVDAIVRANRLSNPRIIHAGQRLQIPGKGAASTAPAKATAGRSGTAASRPAAPTATRTVTVRPGDTLSHIAARHGVPLSDVLRANSNLDPHRLWVGQQVRIPAKATRSAPYTAGTVGKAKKDEKVPNSFAGRTYPSETARAAAANREYLAGVAVPSRAEVKTMIVATAKRHGVDPKLMLALAQMESGWNQRMVSPANAIGVMQVIPSSGQWASELVGRKLNLLDTQDNITAGTVIMRALLRAAADEDQAIAGYYQGLAGVQKNGMYEDTKHYVKTIQALRKQQ
jgi:LysM repeat protein